MKIGSWQTLIVVLVCWWAFAFRLANPWFTNDDFDHLSKARQVLFGELPDRDFWDDGRPLTILASAVAQRLSPTLLSEVILRGGAIAIGVGLVYLLARTLSRSTLLGLLAALFTIAMRPRLYNYPKVLLFPLAVWLLWRYIDRPSRTRLIELTIMTVVAFLFRYDLGVYIAIVYVLTLLALHRARVAPTLAVYIALGLLFCAPYLMWLAAEGRLLSTGSQGIVSMVSHPQGVLKAPVHLDFSRGLGYIAPPPAQIGIRWTTDAGDEMRRALEQRYALDAREGKADGQTIRYYIAHPSPEILQAILSDPRIEDTSGIDRGSGRLLASSSWDQWQTAIPLLRLTFAPILRTREDAGGWLYYVFVASVPLAFLALWLVGDRSSEHRFLQVMSLALLCLTLHQFLIYDSLDSRLPDVAGPTAVLIAWLIRCSVDAVRRLSGVGPRIGRSALIVGLALFALITGPAVTLYADSSWSRVVTAGIERPTTLIAAARSLGRRPLDYWAERGSTSVGLSDYISRCLSPDDRPLIVAYAPEVFYVSGRLFPGGINKFDYAGYNPTGAEIMKRLRGQSVPLVIVDETWRQFLQDDWPDLAGYVATQYREVRVLDFDGKGHVVHVLIDPRRASTTVEPRWGLPCFQPEH